MNPSAPRATNAGAPVDSVSARPKLFDIVTGQVTSIIRDKNVKGALPHALILSFGGTSGYLRARELNGDVATQRATMKAVCRGDVFTVMVSEVKGTVLDPKYELSESRATALLAARSLVGTTVPGQVSNTTKYGAFINLGANRSGLLHVSEMSSTNQKRRLSQLKKGTPVNVYIMSVEVDPTNPAKLRFELSEVEAELKKAAEPTGATITAVVVGASSSGLKLTLKSGVEVSLALENFGSLDVSSLKVGDSLEVRVLGIVGRALSVSYKKEA